VAEELTAFGEAHSPEEKIHRILSTTSCHGSLRAGKKLSLQEMNSLLRRMEETKNIAQCCHGRPSYVTLSINNLGKFFERS
jgi:DNA mismatch repair protein MutL